MIFYIILFLIILAIVIWGAVTQWKFIPKKNKNSLDAIGLQTIRKNPEKFLEQDKNLLLELIFFLLIYNQKVHE